MNYLFRKSIEILKEYQSTSGAFIASPNFDVYKYCWFRDSTYSAYALDLVGDHINAEKFYIWGTKVIERYKEKIKRVEEKLQKKVDLSPDDLLHTRYNVDMLESNDNWPIFQLDGFGVFLWGIAQHIRLTGCKKVLIMGKDGIDLTIRYLSILWDHPCYDCWEEYGDKIHVSTLASIYGGLSNINYFLKDEKIKKLAQDIKEFVLKNGVKKGHLVKFLGTDIVDASLLWVSVPFEMIEPSHPLIKNTVKKIEKDLIVKNGGLHRYKEDSFYGGGEWIILTAWLGWYYTKIGEYEKAKKLKKWIEKQADDFGQLPEQVQHSLYFPKEYVKWKLKWGEVAKPLLWSHALYIILCNSIEQKNQNRVIAGESKRVEIVDVTPSKSFFKPGESVRVEFEIINSSSEMAYVTLCISILWLDKEIHFEEFNMRLMPKEQKKQLFEFCPECEKFLGYGVDAILKDQNEIILDAKSTAFDVLEDWTLAPRYGFLCDFSKSEADTEERVKSIKKFHINCIQFYDWMYRHHNLIPPKEEYVDALGEKLSDCNLHQKINWNPRNIEIMRNRRLSANTLRRKIKEVKRYGIEAIAYGAVYGAEEEFVKEHPDWALYTNDDRIFSLEDLIFIMNISRDCGWHDHILNEYARALKEFDFDGIHLDQYGFPRAAYSHLGYKKKLINMSNLFYEFITDCKRVLSEIKSNVKIIFNAVNGWPPDTLANPEQDVVYIEVWPPHDTYQSLKEIISKARIFAPGKQIVLAAYMSIFNRVDNTQISAAERATLLTFSSINANGAFHLLLGEKSCIITDGYYPAYIRLRADFVEVFQYYWDFIVRYENFLFDHSLKDISLYVSGGIDDELRIVNYPYSSIAKPNTIWVIYKEMPRYKVLSLINFLNILDTHWDTLRVEKVEYVYNIKIEATIQEKVKKILFASPDFTLKPQSLDFQFFKSKKGEGIRFDVPILNCWDMIIFELDQ
ncbi:MAG: hypothetical protein H5T85_01870 [Actinobacteria bacterium]|nr:hypothetical protein [Actinomycetota bacterium]